METTKSLLESRFAPQSSIDNRDSKGINQSSIDNRVSRLHPTLCKMLNDPGYDIGHLYRIVKFKDSRGRGYSDDDIISVAEYCQRRATEHVGKAFVGIWKKKLAR